MRTYKSTQWAGYTAYVVQSIVNNLSPLLFVTYQTTFKVSYAKISLLVLINFVTQLIVDVSSTLFVDKIGYRRCILLANLISACGLCLLPILPYCISPMLGLCTATVIMAIGSGLIEVLVSPLVENLPTEHKAASMSLLHSFFCWGQVAVVILTTLFLRFCGIWQLVPILWALIPLFNFFNFMTVPIINPPKEKSASPKKLMANRTFWMLLLIMACGGASELSMSQWASVFAEVGLSLPKMWGDLLGPCGFAVFMGCGRVLYGLFGHKIDIKKALTFCAVMCIGCYVLVALSPNPVFALIGCMLCGFSVSLMWPGCISLCTVTMRDQGTAMFALLAMGGDLGCSAGPWLTGTLAEIKTGLPIAGLNFGLLVSALFPAIMLFNLLLLKRKKS